MPTPPPTLPPASQSHHQQQSPQIKTYHCLCTHLLLATTHTLSSLPRRKAPGLDKALILPLPPPPPPSSRVSEREGERGRSGSSSAAAESEDGNDADGDGDEGEDREDRDNDDDDDDDTDGEDEDDSSIKHRKQEDTDTDARKARTKYHRHRPHSQQQQYQHQHQNNYSILLSTTLDRKPLMIRREDGFEKRYLWRCGRCRLVVGYQVDEVHYLGRDKDKGKGWEGGRVGDVVYLLPGGLVETEAMVEGRLEGAGAEEGGGGAG
ncbi:MAG: hypothetical protein M1830_001596 [Pleopsidium flavum]|nr:MAG: hypothetical protein M1830_001596 [Pleopsidium flavum]